jgi:hypothetical protein
MSCEYSRRLVAGMMEHARLVREHLGHAASRAVPGA